MSYINFEMFILNSNIGFTNTQCVLPCWGLYVSYHTSISVSLLFQWLILFIGLYILYTLIVIITTIIEMSCCQFVQSHKNN